MLAEKLSSDKSKYSLETVTSEKPVEISVEFIEWRDLSTFVRCGIDGDQVDNLKAAYEADAEVPPVDMFAEKESESKSGKPSDRLRYYIGDSWHRFHAVRELGRVVISAVVHAGGRREALKFALGANAAHGLRLTNRDKRKAVELALREFPTLSNRAIAELCRVSHVMVNDVRKQVEESSTCAQAMSGRAYDSQPENCAQNTAANHVRAHTGLDGKRYPAKMGQATQLDFFELVGREWAPVVKSFDLTIRSVAWLDERVTPERKLEAISSIRRQLDDMRAQLSERERAIKSGIGQQSIETTAPKPANQMEGAFA